VKRTGRVRLDISKQDLKLKPDMYVDLVIDMDMGRSLVGRRVRANLPTGKAQHRHLSKKATANANARFELGGGKLATFTPSKAV